MITVSDAWKAAHEQTLLPEMFVEITMDIPEESTSLVFDKNQIISYTHEQSGDPISRELSTSKIEFSLDNVDGKWNPLNPDGVYKYLSEQRKLTVRYGLQLDSGIEWIQAGIFYLTEWKVPNNGLEAKFVAGDVFSVLRDIGFTRHPKLTVRGAYYDPVPFFATREEAGYYGVDEDITPLGTVAVGTQVTAYERKYFVHEPDWGARFCWRIEQGWIPDSLGSKPNSTDDPSDTLDIVSSMLNLLPFEWHCPDNLEAFATEGDMLKIYDNVNVAECLQQTCNACLFAHWQDTQGYLHFEMLGSEIGDYCIDRKKSYTYPEISLPVPVADLEITLTHFLNTDYTKTYQLTIGDTGETLVVDNPYIPHNLFNPVDEELRVKRKQAWITAYTPKPTLSGEFRVDPRLELFDVIQVEDKFGNFHEVRLTYIKYTYTGSFRGTYTGTII